MPKGHILSLGGDGVQQGHSIDGGGDSTGAPTFVDVPSAPLIHAVDPL
jgi:hypothetical protein